MYYNQLTNSFILETALLKVHNDVTLNMDKGKVTALTLLDLSAAFDTIDLNILIKRHVIQTHNLDHHIYADDTQIYLSLATPNTNCSLN